MTKQGMTMDMTQGRPMGLILRFAVPIFLGAIFQQIYTMVDTVIVGHILGEGALSAIGATSSIHALMMNLAICMNNGFGIVLAQAFGARDTDRVRRCVAAMLLLNIAVAAVLTAVSVALLDPMMVFMNTPEAIFDRARDYVLILFLGLGATAGYNLFANVLRSVGNSKTPLYCLIISSVLNILLDVLLVAVIPLGVAGAALATVISQAVSALLCAGALFRRYRQLTPRRGDWGGSRSLWGPMMSAGSAMALMLCVVNVGSILFQRANNALGEAIIAAHTASYKVITNTFTPLSSLATACSTFVSQNWGAGQWARIRQGLFQSCALAALCGVASIAVVFPCGGWLIWAVTGTEDAFILENAVMNMRFVASGLPALGILLCLRTSMQSMGHKVMPVLSSCVELAVKALGAGLLIPRYGFLGSCMTDPLTWFAMTAFLVAAYLITRRKIYPDMEVSHV